MDPTSRQALEACLADAFSRAAWQAEVTTNTSLEGTYVLATEPEASHPLVLAVAVSPSKSPFDEIVRDRARSVAGRLGATWILVTSFRNTVLYETDAVTRRLPQNDMILAQATGADVLSVEDVMVSSNRIAETESIKKCLVHGRKCATEARERASRSDFLIQRVTSLLNELLSCTDGTEHHVASVERLGTSILGYGLLTIRYSETLQSMQLPYGIQSSALILDLVGAYLREANRQGHHLFPDSIADLHVHPHRDQLFSSTVADLVHLIESIRLDRFKKDEVHHLVDAILLWCARIRSTPVPTIDAIDLAIMASPLSDLPHQAQPRIIEIGSTIGMFGVRTRLILPRAETRVFAATDLEERQLLLRASGQLQQHDDVRILHSLSDATEPWDIVCLAFTHNTDPYQLQTTLKTLTISPSGAAILYVPLSVLRERSFAEFRQFLTTNFDLRWVFTADAEPLAEPDNGTCCLVLQPLLEGGSPEPTNFGFIRTAMSALIPPAPSLRSFSLDRAERLRVFLRYLVSSERGKINQEVVVRRVARSSLTLRAWDSTSGWDDFIVPPDVIASILRKLSGNLRTMDECGEIFSGLRTGANDVLAPDVGTIAERDLEDVYWQRTLQNGDQVDTTIITAADEVASIAGIPSADRRLLLLPSDRSAMEGTNVLTHVERAERDGVHSRPSLRSRDPWWHLEAPPTPDLIIPKQQRQRWLIATNPSHAFITDSCIGVALTDPSQTQALAVWMNSSLGMFLSELVQTAEHVADVTVRDAREFLVPSSEILSRVDPRTFKDLLYRPQHSLADEFGTDDPDLVRPNMVKRDRRRLDRFFMEDVFGMTAEEQRWIYRFALAWRGSSTNIRHLGNALATQISMTERLQPMWQWYAPRVEQLPEGTTRTLVLESHTTKAVQDQSMFTHQVTLYKGNKRDDVIECATADEAELITLLVNLGKRTVEIPLDEPLLHEVLGLVKTFSEQLNGAVDAAIASVPKDIRPAVHDHILTAMVS